MQAADWRLVGKIKEAHGLKGDVFVLVFSGETGWMENLKEFAYPEGPEQSLKILSIEKLKSFKKGLILKAQNIQSRTQAEDLKGKPLYVPETLFQSQVGERIFLSEILDFEVFDKGALVGKIVGFSSNGPQDLLKVLYLQKECEIPFVQDFVLDIDFQGKKVLMQLPEGLLDIDHVVV